ncbi:MAG: class C sortase [Defluviitaleaceae bacterium]|nr:class C sortase [Defluviitaleaceae bacterium]
MRRALSTFLLVIMMLAGVGFFVYPDVASWWNGRNQRGMVVAYDEEVSQMSYARRNAMLQQAHEYNAARPDIAISDPFADASALPDTYLEILNVSDVMARIEIPAINVSLPILHGTSTAVLDVAAGHLMGTHFPVGGYGTHSVITAHSGLSNARMFTDLLSEHVGYGTIFFITVLDQRLAYMVDDVQAVYPHEVDALRVYPGRDLVTLITCTPLAVNSHRLLVRGTRIEYSPYLIDDIVPYITIFDTNWRLIVTFGIFLLFILVFSIYQLIRILRGRHSKMLERKIEQLERQLAIQKQKAKNPAYAAGLNNEFNDPYIAIPANQNPEDDEETPKKRHINPAILKRVQAQAKRRKAHQLYMRKVSAGIAILLMVVGAGIMFYPRVQQHLHTRYAESIINEWRNNHDEYRARMIMRWHNEREEFFETVSDVSIAYNGDIVIADSGHIFLNHAADIAFGASGSPGINNHGYLTLGGAPVGNNGYITVGDISVSHNGSLNISTTGSISMENLSLSPSGDVYVGNYNIGNIAIEVPDYSGFNLDFLFNFCPINDDPFYWLYKEMVDYNYELDEDNQAGLISLAATEEVDFSVVNNGGFSEEMLGYITIERMDIILPIFAGSNHSNMLRGAAHLTQSSLPVGGINTNSVITAHRGLSRARMFRDIHLLQIGDEIRITNHYETLVYRVVDPYHMIEAMPIYKIYVPGVVIQPYEIGSIKIRPGRDMITLMSCYPYRFDTQRILVFAERVRN